MPSIAVSKSKRFATAGPDLRIFAFHETPKQLAFSIDLSQVRLASWNPHERYQDFLAVSCRSSSSDAAVTICKVVVDDCGNSRVSSISESLYERRDCNFLEWSTVDPEILLGGFAKAKDDSPSIVLWDVNNPLNMIQGFGEIKGYCNSLTAMSIAWLTNQAIFVAGVDGGGKMSKSSLVAFDARQEGECFSISTKSVLGTCADPSSDYRFATYGESGAVVKIWDSRFTAAEVAVIHTEFKSGVSCISWRGSSLSASSKEGVLIKVWNLHTIPKPEIEFSPGSTSNISLISDTANITEVSYDRTVIVPVSKAKVTQHRWSVEKKPQYLLYSVDREPRIGVIKVPVKTILEWSPTGYLYLAQESTIKRHSCEKVIQQESDISGLIRERASKGYAMVSDNLELVKDNQRLTEAWKYIQSISD